MSDPPEPTSDERARDPALLDTPFTQGLVIACQAGHPESWSRLLERSRARLERMLRLRLPPILRGRVDLAGLLQEISAEARRGFRSFDSGRFPSFYLWLRRIALRYLEELQRELSLDETPSAPRFARGTATHATRQVLAEQLLGHVSEASGQVERAEREACLYEALDELDELDREMIALRDFEELSYAELAVVLDMEPAVAKKRYFRAILRLKRRIGRA